MRSRSVLLIPGIAAILVSIALAGSSFVGLSSALAGFSPTPEFTPATCVPGQTCPTATAGKPKTHTPTPAPPTETSVAVTNTPAPPTVAPATSTPLGGSEGAGVRPPDTGTGDGLSGTSGQPWLLIAAVAMLALFGVGATAAGVKRR